MSPFPLETWENIFSFLSPTATDADSWRRIARDDKYYRDFSDDASKEHLQTMRAIGLVSKTFRSLLRSVGMQSIMLRSGDEIEDLSHALHVDDRVAELARRWTRRIDVVLLGPQNPKDMYILEYSFKNKQVRLFRQIHKHLGTILKACPNLIYFTLRTDDRFFIDHDAIRTTFSNASPALEVLRWHFDYEWGYYDQSRLSLLPDFHHLQVLDFSLLKDVESFGVPERAIKVFPCLHTVIGPAVFVYFALSQCTVPSFRTFICTRSFLPWGSAGYDDPQPFNQITTLNIIESKPGSWTRHMFSEVTDLVVPSSAVPRLLGGWCNVRTLGIVEETCEEDDFRNPPVLENILSKREGRRYMKLRTIRLLRREADEPLLISDDARTRLQKWSINIEDACGNLLFSHSS